LTNKVDRCVGGKVAKQQTTGPLQLPLNNCGVMAWITTERGVATSIGHSPVAFTRSCFRSSAIAELYQYCLGTYQRRFGRNFISANWMWACKKKEKMLVCTLP
jgi:phosphoribosylformylglycinamidine synthase